MADALDKVRVQQLSLQRLGTAATVVMATTSVIQLMGALRPSERRTGQMAHSIVKAREAHRNMRRRIAQEVQQREHTFAACAVAGAVGIYEANNNKPLPGFGSIDGTIIFGFGSLIAGEYIGGRGGRICQSVADGLLSVGVYKYAKAFARTGLPSPSVGAAGETSTTIVGDAAADARAMDALFSAS